MNSTRLLKILAGVAVLAGVATVVAVGLDNRRLRQRVAALRGKAQQAERLREANQQTQAVLARIRGAGGDSARLIQTELAQARVRVSDLERKALATHRQMRTQAEADAASLANNHDPEKGLTRLENCRDVGTATPAATFQTFAWAALKGEDQRLAAMISFDDEARVKAESAVAALPEAARAQYDTPEKLAALCFAAALTAQPSAHIVEVAFKDSQTATVSVRGLTEKIQRVPMRLGAQGWQIMIPPTMAGSLAEWAKGGRRSPGR